MRIESGGGGYETRPGIWRRDFPRAEITRGQRDGETAPTAESDSTPARGSQDGQATTATRQPGATGPGGEPLSEEERAEVAELRKRDAEVRAHEAAHQAAAGSAGGGATFTYATGPDGKQYAVGGEVSVQIRSGNTPEETIRNAARVRAAALAPADPSAQDRAVAAEAAAMEAAARAELMQARAQGASSLPGPGAVEASPAVEARPDVQGLKADQERAGQSPPAVEGSTRAVNVRAADVDASLLAIQNQTRPSTSGWRHLHSDGCAGCAARVAIYR
jgi:hypothetical protein